MIRPRSLEIPSLLVLAYGALLVNAKQQVFGTSSAQDSITLDLSSHFNNKAASGTKDVQGFDGEGNRFVKESLPQDRWVHAGVEFDLPDWDAVYDNIRVDGQTIKLDDPVTTSSVHILGVGGGYLGFLQHNPPQNLTLECANGFTDLISIEAKQWWGLHGTQHGDIIGHSRHLASGSIDYNLTQIFHTAYDIPIRPARCASALISVTLPPSRAYNSLHIFALTILPARIAGDASHTPSTEDRLLVRSVRGTKRHSEDFRGSIVEVLVANPWSLSHVDRVDYWMDTPAHIELNRQNGFETVAPAMVHRLMPGEEALVEMLVQGTAIRSWSQHVRLEGILDGDEKYEATMESTAEHSAPSWYRDAKFGIFIHWGPYAVPAWNTPPQYAEWYWYWLQTEGRDGATYKHHFATYGSDFEYDQFLHQFSASRYNASAWVELFAEAGTRYFVLTSKHHDGFALFDTGNSSNRNSLQYGPKRDLLKELFDAAEAEQPQLHRGTYFSMPEWFAPSYHPVGKVIFPGGPAVNPYNGKPEGYTGGIKDVDFIHDVQYHQMKILAEKYKTEIMWCDIGLSNNSYQLAADWYNEAGDARREVVMNDRCGIPADFDTPEMVHYSTVNKAFWESNMGMDPYSFGYTITTKAEEYRSAANIIHTLIDIVSKGGNFLLNIGFTSSGEIVQAMAEPLRGAGRWLSTYGEAVYGAHTIPLLPEYTPPGVNLRFTRNDNKLYILSLSRPESTLYIDVPLPIFHHEDVVS